MRVGIPKETAPLERRTALTPVDAAALIKAGLDVFFESGTGERAAFPDAAYEAAGAKKVPAAAALYAQSDLVLKVQRPLSQAAGRHEADLLKPGSILIGLLSPRADPDLVRRLAERRITALSMDAVPRIARAQKMDALSSQSAVAGYKAVLLAAGAFGRFFPLMMTAAGTFRPAKVLVIGAGVAGLQAIATARRLGAVVHAYDVRPAAKEQVRSLGAVFIEQDMGRDTEDARGYARELSEEAKRRQQAFLGRHVADADVVITTALVPGRRAPVLITEETAAGMRPGSVIVDAAAEAGGNCALTQPGREVVRGGVTVLGPENLPASMPEHASAMYSKNILSLVLLGVSDGAFRPDFSDEIFRGCRVGAVEAAR